MRWSGLARALSVILAGSGASAAGVGLFIATASAGLLGLFLLIRQLGRATRRDA